MTDFEKARNRYFRWLLKQVDYNGVKEELNLDYSNLLRSLFEREFYWDVPHDNNRLTDGIRLRIEAGYHEYNFGPCSLLEVMIAFARRIAHEIVPDFSGDTTANWFWVMIENCGAGKYDNDNWDEDKVHFLESLVMYRGYESDGKGGFFPLKEPIKDQRKVELWYQMQSYIMENCPI